MPSHTLHGSEHCVTQKLKIDCAFLGMVVMCADISDLYIVQLNDKWNWNSNLCKVIESGIKPKWFCRPNSCLTLHSSRKKIACCIHTLVADKLNKFFAIEDKQQSTNLISDHYRFEFFFFRFRAIKLLYLNGNACLSHAPYYQSHTYGTIDLPYKQTLLLFYFC